jgi:hypothetical protein
MAIIFTVANRKSGKRSPRDADLRPDLNTEASNTSSKSRHHGKKSQDTLSAIEPASESGATPSSNESREKTAGTNRASAADKADLKHRGK